MEKQLKEILKKDIENREKYEKELKKICEKSKRITYTDIIEKLQKITENKLHRDSYKFTTFIGWLVEDLNFCKMVNEETWDMTIEEIDTEDKSMEEWEKEFDKLKNEDNFNFKNVEEFRDCSLDWSYTHSLDNIFSGLKYEYEHRKEKGLI